MKKSFEELLKNAEVIQEYEKGKLKGGFSSLSSNFNVFDNPNDNEWCSVNQTNTVTGSCGAM